MTHSELHQSSRESDGHATNPTERLTPFRIFSQAPSRTLLPSYLRGMADEEAFCTEDEGPQPQFATPGATTNNQPAKPASRSTKKRALKKPADEPMADAFLTTDEEPCANATKMRAPKNSQDAFLTMDEEPCAKAVATNKARAKANGGN